MGLNKQGADRLEIRHISDVKVAYLREGAKEAQRPKRGRPRKEPDTSPAVDTSEDTLPDQNKQTVVVGKPARSTRNPAPNYVATIDVFEPRAGNSKRYSTHADPVHSGPPPVLGFPPRPMWSASNYDLDIINRSISRSIA